MGEDTTEPRAILAEIMDYDPEFYEGMTNAQMSALQRWLADNESSWLYLEGMPKLADMYGPRTLVVVGEAGSGKTTFTNLTARSLKRDHVVVYLDFKIAVKLAGVRPEDAVRELNAYLKEAIESQVERAGFGDAYKATRVRTIISDKSHASLSRLRLKYPDVASWTDPEMIGSTEVAAAVSEYESQSREDYVSITAVQMMTAARTVIIADNIDALDKWLIQLIFKKLHACHRSDTILLVAIRSENQDAADVLLNGRRDQAIHMAQENGLLLKIAETRNTGALEYCLSSCPEKTEEARVRHDAIADALEKIRNDSLLMSLTSRWLNGNIRQWLTLVSEVSLDIRAANDTPNSLNGIIASQLIGTRYPPRLFELLAPNRVYTEKYAALPFVLLPMGILVYVANRHSKVLLKDLLDDFWQEFGIGPRILHDDIAMLCERKIGRPQLMRMIPDPDGATALFLLPCGEEFVNHVLYGVDYLAQVYDRNLRDYPIAVDSRHSVTKLRKSCAVVSRILLPAFRDEHPYLRPDRAIAEREKVRLTSYETMFNYGKGRWFVDRLRMSLESYSRERDIYKQEFAKTDALLRSAVAQLDEAAAQSEGA